MHARNHYDNDQIPEMALTVLLILFYLAGCAVGLEIDSSATTIWSLYVLSAIVFIVWHHLYMTNYTIHSFCRFLFFLPLFGFFSIEAVVVLNAVRFALTDVHFLRDFNHVLWIVFLAFHSLLFLKAAIYMLMMGGTDDTDT